MTVKSNAKSLRPIQLARLMFKKTTTNGRWKYHASIPQHTIQELSKWHETMRPRADYVRSVSQKIRETTMSQSIFRGRRRNTSLKNKVFRTSLAKLQDLLNALLVKSSLSFQKISLLKTLKKLTTKMNWPNEINLSRSSRFVLKTIQTVQSPVLTGPLLIQNCCLRAIVNAMSGLWMKLMA